MNEAKRNFLLAALKLSDLALLLAAYILATVLVVHAHPGMSLALFLSMRVKLENLVLFSGMVVLWHLILSSCGMYGSRRLSTRQSIPTSWNS